MGSAGDRLLAFEYPLHHTKTIPDATRSTAYRDEHLTHPAAVRARGEAPDRDDRHRECRNDRVLADREGNEAGDQRGEDPPDGDRTAAEPDHSAQQRDHPCGECRDVGHVAHCEWSPERADPHHDGDEERPRHPSDEQPAESDDRQESAQADGRREHLDRADVPAEQRGDGSSKGDLSHQRHRDPVVERDATGVGEAEEREQIRPVVAPGDPERAGTSGDDERYDQGDQHQDPQDPEEAWHPEPGDRRWVVDLLVVHLPLPWHRPMGGFTAPGGRGM